MSRIANIPSISKKERMVIGLMMLYFTVFASGMKRPHSQISPPAESEKSQALRAKIAKLTETRDEAEESNQDTRVSLEGLQNKYNENAKELIKIKRHINLALLEFDVKLMGQDGLPKYTSKRWGLIDFRRFEVLYKQICDENPHMLCDSEQVESDFNTLVDRVVFGEGWPRQVQAQVMNEDVERELQNIEEQWGTEMSVLVVEAIMELQEYVSSHPDLDFNKRDNFFTPYDNGRKKIAAYEDATKYLSVVVKVLVDLTAECICEQENPTPKEEEEEDGDSMPPHVDNHHSYCMPGINWEDLDHRSDDERHLDPEAIFYQHHGHV